MRRKAIRTSKAAKAAKAAKPAKPARPARPASPAKPRSSTVWFVYIVRCSDSTLYTGIATDLERRIAVHNRGKGAKYTRSRRPVELVWFARARSRSTAQRREAAIKRLSAREKKELAEGRG